MKPRAKPDLFPPGYLAALRDRAERIGDDADERDPNVAALVECYCAHGSDLWAGGLRLRCYAAKGDALLLGDSPRELRDKTLAWLAGQGHGNGSAPM